MSRQPSHALVLAGSRGPTDPVAKARGLPHKALVPVLGTPMLLRVVETLLADPSIRHITLSLDRALRDHGLGPELDALIKNGSIDVAEPKNSPCESVAHIVDHLRHQAEAWPLLVTTADHPLLTPAMVRHFIEERSADADFSAGLAEARVIKGQYPDAVRTFYTFRGRGYSGCNLFMLESPRAEAFVTFWQEMEQHRKRPWRLIARVGFFELARFLTGRLSLDAALDHLSRRVGAKATAVLMPFAEAAIDVDKPSDLALAETILKARA